MPPEGIRYTNVPPGRYQFHIVAGWASGPWGDEVTSATITIARPFQRTPWFFALVAAAIAAAGLGVHGIRTQAIRARNRELEALTVRLNESIAEREHLIEDLEAKNQELERFTYTVSHDLKSPLVTIKGFLGLLEKDAAAGDADRLQRDVERIGAAADTMGQLLGELLELSRIGRMVNPPEDVPLAGLVAEALEVVAGRIGENGVAVEIAPDLPVVRGDRVRLLEVMQNLVENAIKFMGDQPAPRIEIGARQDPGEPSPVFYVADNGIGIEPRFHDKVFGLFERLDQQVDGTGVGLTVVKRIVEIHGGRIWVESEGEGRGTTFCFTLPDEEV
ncbi:MAG: hypothetical protein GY719_41745 [bacterium]|nr:hypothetical protein [bacterium]